MAARAAEDADTTTDPCEFEPGGGYRRLENRLYRVEIHDPGNDVAATAATYKWSRDNGSVVVSVEEFRNTGGGTTTTEITVRRLGLDATQELNKDDWIEIVSDDLVAAGLPGQLVQIASQPDPSDRILALSSAVDIKTADLHPQVRRWDMPVDGAEKVRTTWRELEDGVEIRFGAGVYHTGDYRVIPARTNTADVEWPPLPEYPGHEPAGAPEQLPPFGIAHQYAPLAALVHDGTEIVASVDMRSLFPPITDLAVFAYAGGDGQEPVLPSGVIPQPLQASVTNGSGPVVSVLIEFAVVEGNSDLALGATTGTLITVPTDADGLASIAWTVDPADTDHRVRARLLDDCGDATHAPVFFSARVGYQLHYLSGDGQSGAPGETLAPLRVWVSDGRRPVEGMEIEFTVTAGGGTLSAGSVTTDADGFAETTWTLDEETYHQQVQARLLDAGGDPVHEAAIQFNARVNYQLHFLSGDGQEAMPGQTVEPLRVWVSDGHEPVAGMDVEFTVTSGAGTLSPSGAITTDADGIAQVLWTLDAVTYRQQVQAQLVDGGGSPVHDAAVRFNANLSIASEVAYTPAADCTTLAGLTNVQDALDALCRVERSGGGCTISLVPGDNLESVFASLGGVGTPDITICFAEGLYEIEKALSVGGLGHVRVSGVGRGTRIVARSSRSVLVFRECESVTVRDLDVEAPAEASDNSFGALDIEDCGAVSVEGVIATCGSAAEPMTAGIAVRRSDNAKYGLADPIRIRACDVTVGEQQPGIVVANGVRIHVEDNTVASGMAGAQLDLGTKLTSSDYVDKALPNLVQFVDAGGSGSIRQPDSDPAELVTVSQGDWTVSFLSPVANQRIWAEEIAALNPTSETQARAAVTNIARTVIENEGALGSRLVFRNWFRAFATTPDAGLTGIMLSGAVAEDVRVLNNSISGTLAGVTAELRRSDGGDAQIGSMLLSGNRVVLPANAVAARESRALSVRDVDSLVADDNFVQVGSATENISLAVIGISVEGAIGPRLVIGANHFTRTVTGVRVAPTKGVPEIKRWVAVSNVATQGVMLDAPCEVREDGNVPRRGVPCAGDQAP